MSYAVATQADTSSNQAIKDPSQRRCDYSDLGKFINLIESVAARGVSAGCLRSPTSSETKSEGVQQSLLERPWMSS